MALHIKWAYSCGSFLYPSHLLANEALGKSNQGTGHNSLATGRQNIASGQDAIAIGSTFNNTTGLGTMSLGTSNSTAESAYSNAMGIFNTLETSPQATSFADVTNTSHIKS